MTGMATHLLQVLGLLMLLSFWGVLGYLLCYLIVKGIWKGFQTLRADYAGAGFFFCIDQFCKRLLWSVLRKSFWFVLFLCHLALLLGHLGFYVASMAIGIGVMMGGGTVLAVMILSFFRVAKESPLWMFICLVGAFLVGPGIVGSALHFSRPGRWLVQTWNHTTHGMQARMDSLLGQITRSQALLEKNETFQALDAALRIVNTYSKILAALPATTNYVPVTLLPIPKNNIYDAIVLLYASLPHTKIQERVKHWYPAQATHLLSAQFLEALREGARALPLFLPEQELATMQEWGTMTQRVSAAEAQKQSVDMKSIAEKIASTPFFKDVVRIQARVLEEQSRYLSGLDQARALFIARKDIQ